MTEIKTRLERSAAVLAVIDYRRRQTRNRNLGYGLERFIVERELKELADEWMAASLATPIDGVAVRKNHSA